MNELTSKDGQEKAFQTKKNHKTKGSVGGRKYGMFKTKGQGEIDITSGWESRGEVLQDWQEMSVCVKYPKCDRKALKTPAKSFK